MISLLRGLAFLLVGGAFLRAAETPVAPPVTERWPSEAFSEMASAQLGRFGALLTENSAKMPEDLLSPDAVCPVVPSALETVEKSDRLTVRKMAPGSPARTVPVEKLAASLHQPFTSLRDGRVKFKLFATDFSHPAKPVTRQYVTLAGPSSSGYLEQNATWRISWRWDGERPPLMTGIDLESFEEVLLASADRKPLFRDNTTEVIGDTPAFQEQLRFGNTHWRQRIEVFNRFFKFGHHGLAVGDANGDGLDDLYVCQNGGLPNRLFIQQPDGSAIDVAAELGVDLLDLTRSALFVDLDNDGDQDLVVATDTGLLAFRNDGSGRFEAKLRVPSVANAFSLSAADYDNDGDLDLYVCRYFANKEEGADLAVPVPYFDANNGGGNYLIRNDGPSARSADWLDLSDVTVESGLDGQNNRRFSFAAVWDDLDDDGDQDLFVANDYGLKNLYVNDNGVFRDVALAAGVDDGGFGMSACSGDYDRDGITDLYFGNMFSAAGSRVTHQPHFRPGIDPAILARFQHMARGNSLFRGLARTGEPRYADVSIPAGVTVGRWSWGSLFADVNNDGWEDLVVTNGFVTGEVPDDL